MPSAEQPDPAGPFRAIARYRKSLDPCGQGLREGVFRRVMAETGTAAARIPSANRWTTCAHRWCRGGRSAGASGGLDEPLIDLPETDMTHATVAALPESRHLTASDRKTLALS